MHRPWKKTARCTDSRDAGDFDQVGAGWRGLVRFGLDWYELVRFGMNWYKLVQIGTDWYDLVWIDMI